MFIEKALAATTQEAAKETTNRILTSLNEAFPFIPGGLNNILIFGLTIGGAIAFGTIVYGGIIYSMSGDNAAKQKEATAWIWAAVKGLAVIAFGFILLALINPAAFTAPK